MAAQAVEVEVLRTELNRILDLFVQSGVSKIELNRDYYWSFDWDTRHLQSAGQVEPPRPSVGSLHDDLEFVLSGREDEPMALMLCHIAPLLNYLGITGGDLGVFHRGK